MKKQCFNLAVRDGESGITVEGYLYEYDGIKYFIDKREDSGHYVSSEYYTGLMITSNKKLSLCKIDTMFKIDKAKDYIIKAIKKCKHINN